MKKVINSILIIGTIIAFLFALKYSALPVPSVVPDIFCDFFVTTIEEQQQYVFVYDFSVGFILSALFYFVVEELPNIVRIIKARRLISAPINQLLESMEQIISITIAKYKRNNNLQQLSQKDFLVLDGETIISNEKNVFTTESFHLNNSNFAHKF